MTEPTTSVAAADPPHLASAPAPTNGLLPTVPPERRPGPAAGVAPGVGVADARTLRQVSRAEQERLTADADVERRARRARLALELREQRRQATRRERDADAADNDARVRARRARRAALRARWMAAAPRWADRALFVLPILFPMAVAWVGQIRFAMTVMGWPLAAAVVFAAGFELSTAYVARLDWLSRAAGDSGLLFRSATWAFAAGAATMNYWHAAGPGFAPNGEAVSYGLMSITGVVLWELLSTYRHRTSLRAEGKRPAARPRFGLARWIWFRPLTRIAALLALRDGHSTIDLAWDAALRAVDEYGSVKEARKAIRAGRPVPRPELPADDGSRSGTRTETTSDPDDASETARRDVEHEPIHRDGLQRDALCPASVGETTSAEAELNDRDEEPTDVSLTVRPPAVDRDVDAQVPDACRDVGGRRQVADRAVRARMEAFARASLDAGETLTGADLDRRFGTRDYGRKVLRQLLYTTGRSPGARLEKLVTRVGTDRPAEMR